MQFCFEFEKGVLIDEVYLEIIQIKKYCIKAPNRCRKFVKIDVFSCSSIYWFIQVY